MSATVKAACGLDLDSLDKLPLDVVLAKPTYKDNKLVDAEVVWANQKVKSRNLFEPVGLKFSAVYPQLVNGDFLHNLSRERGKYPTEMRPFKRTVFGPRKIPYDLTTFWAGELIYAHVNEMDPELTIEEGLPFALQLIFGSISKLPFAVSYRRKNIQSRFATEAFLEGFSVPHDVFESIELTSLVHIDDKEIFENWIENPTESTALIRVAYRESAPRWVELSASEVVDLLGDSHGQLYTFIDVDDQVKLRRALEKSQAEKTHTLSMLTNALNVSRDGFAVWATASHTRLGEFILEYINEAGAAPTGRKPSDLVGKPISQVLPTDYEDLSKLFRRALETKSQQVDVVEVNSEAGWVGAYENRVVPLTNHQVVTNFRDISAERRETNRLEWLVTHDHLTGLINRRGLEDAIDDRLNLLRTEGSEFGFAFIDLDGFKELNDELGHEGGDRVLRELAGILVEMCLENHNLAARISGDEFALLINEIDGHDHCAEIIESLRAKVASHFIRILGRSLNFSAGTVQVASSNTDKAEILRVADRAMYQAKNAGKNTARHAYI